MPTRSLRSGCALLLALPLAAADLIKAESLAAGTLYNDQVARAAGDLLTIVVKEATSVSETAKTETSRDNSAGFDTPTLPFPATGIERTGADGNPTLPAMALKSSKEFSGEGKAQNSAETRAVITGRITDVLDNGNLVVVGTRRVQAGENTKTIRISGIVRAADIRSDNTVASEKVSNLEVAIEGEGPLSRSQQEGWLGRLIDTVWPF